MHHLRDIQLFHQHRYLGAQHLRGPLPRVLAQRGFAFRTQPRPLTQLGLALPHPLPGPLAQRPAPRSHLLPGQPQCPQQCGAQFAPESLGQQFRQPFSRPLSILVQQETAQPFLHLLAGQPGGGDEADPLGQRLPVRPNHLAQRPAQQAVDAADELLLHPFTDLLTVQIVVGHLGNALHDRLADLLAEHPQPDLAEQPGPSRFLLDVHLQGRQNLLGHVLHVFRIGQPDGQPPHHRRHLLAQFFVQQLAQFRGHGLFQRRVRGQILLDLRAQHPRQLLARLLPGQHIPQPGDQPLDLLRLQQPTHLQLPQVLFQHVDQAVLHRLPRFSLAPVGQFLQRSPHPPLQPFLLPACGQLGEHLGQTQAQQPFELVVDEAPQTLLQGRLLDLRHQIIPPQ